MTASATSPQDQAHRSPLSKIRELAPSAKRQIIPFVLDLIIFIGAFCWWVVGFPHRFLFSLIFVILLRWRRFERFILVRIVYILVSLLFIGAAILGFFPLYCISKHLYLLALASIPLCLCVVFIRRAISVRAVVSCLIPAVAIIFLKATGENVPSEPQDCQPIHSQEDVETLLDLSQYSHSQGSLRYMVRRLDIGDMLIAYRSVLMQPRETSHCDLFDPATGILRPVPALKDEVIGLYYYQPKQQIIASSVTKDPDHPKVLRVLDVGLNLIADIDFPPGSNDYNAYMMEYEGKIAIQSDRLFWFDPETNRLWQDSSSKPADIFGCRTIAENGFAPLPDKMLIAGGADPFFYTLLYASALCLIDLKTLERRTYRSGLNGSWDCTIAFDRREILATSFWRDKIWVVSLDALQHLRTLKIGPCVRPIAYDPRNGLGYTVESFSGIFKAFDVVTGEVKMERYVGKNARRIYIYEDLGILILTGCGIIRIEVPVPSAA